MLYIFGEREKGVRTLSLPFSIKLSLNSKHNFSAINTTALLSEINNYDFMKDSGQTHRSLTAFLPLRTSNSKVRVANHPKITLGLG